MIRNIRIFILPAWLLVIVILDQLSKWAIADSLQYLESKVIIPGFFNLTFITNTGGAFGMFSGRSSGIRHLLFIGFACLALGVLLYTYRQVRFQAVVYLHAIGLIVGGAVGNLIDRIRFGRVIDFLDVYYKHYHWPAFNVADSAISIGVILFIGAQIWAPISEPEIRE